MRRTRSRGIEKLGRRLAFFDFEAENGHDFLQVFPDFTFGGRVAQQVGGMVSGHQFFAAKIEPLAAELRHTAIGLKQSFRGGGAEADDDFGVDDVKLAQKKRRTSANFILFRQAIVGRAALHHVADVDVFALQAHGFDHLRQKFTRSTDEWKTLGVFVGTGAFADKNQLRFGISIAENNGMATAVEFAASAFAKVFASFEEGIV